MLQDLWTCALGTAPTHSVHPSRLVCVIPPTSSNCGREEQPPGAYFGFLGEAWTAAGTELMCSVSFCCCEHALQLHPCAVLSTVPFLVSTFLSRPAYGFVWGTAFCHKITVTHYESDAGGRQKRKRLESTSPSQCQALISPLAWAQACKYC